MNIYGLIGRKLSHSFSQKYFTEKFEKEGIKDCEYQLFELEDISAIENILNEHPQIKGLNVTIPYKEQVIPYLNNITEEAEKIGAVNVIKVEADKKLVGYNSDYIGFLRSLEAFIPQKQSIKALVLGTGGASKAVQLALQNMNIPYVLVSRKVTGTTAPQTCITYGDITKEIMEEYQLIVNTTPLGMFPNESTFPDIPYQYCTENHYLFDLVYNPSLTQFMHLGKENSGHIKNGLEMLHLQAEAAWEIWQ